MNEQKSRLSRMAQSFLGFVKTMLLSVPVLLLLAGIAWIILKIGVGNNWGENLLLTFAVAMLALAIIEVYFSWKENIKRGEVLRGLAWVLLKIIAFIIVAMAGTWLVRSFGFALDYSRGMFLATVIFGSLVMIITFYTFLQALREEFTQKDFSDNTQEGTEDDVIDQLDSHEGTDNGESVPVVPPVAEKSKEPRDSFQNKDE